MRQPPQIASALLKYFGPLEPGSIGDLLEEFQSGESSGWYWRQVASIIAQKVVGDIRQSPGIVVTIMASGLALTIIAPPTITAIIGFDQWLFVRGFGWFYRNRYGLPSSMATHPWWIATTFYVSLGWCVGRISQSRQAAMVSMFASSIFISDLALLSYHLTTHPVDFDSVYNLAQLILFTVVILPLATLTGGLSAGLRSSNRSRLIA